MAALAVALAGCSPVYRQAPPGARSPGPEPSGSRGEAGSLERVLGALVWPLAMDRATILSSGYGQRRSPGGGGSRFHTGLDLRAEAGTPIHAVADGWVLASLSSGAYGNLVVVDHGAELRSLYAHNRSNLVTAGDRVRRGQVIALVGRTGNATGDHLHFELRWRGGTVDPLLVLPPLGRDRERGER